MREFSDQLKKFNLASLFSGKADVQVVLNESLVSKFEAKWNELKMKYP